MPKADCAGPIQKTAPPSATEAQRERMKADGAYLVDLPTAILGAQFSLTDHFQRVLCRDLVRAAETIHTGGVIAYPTEAVFGLGCDPLNEAAVEKLLALKQRPPDKGLILIAAEFAQLEAFLKPLDDALMQRVANTWPGPVTWLVSAKAHVPIWLRGSSNTLAVRVTAHPIASALCRHAGCAIVSTSANLAGQHPARSADAVRQAFGAAIDFLLDGPLGNSDRPTEIRNAISGEIIRAG